MANNKARCKQCLAYKDQVTMLSVPIGRFCDHECMFSFIRAKQQDDRVAQKKKVASAMRQEKKEHRAKKRAFKESDAKVQKSLAQKAFNAFIRYRDRGLPCISCGSVTVNYQAGHYRSVGSAPHLRFNQFNVMSQCIRCNKELSGNLIEYRRNLVKKIGVEKVEWIEAQDGPLRFKVADFIAIKIYYTKLLKGLKDIEK